MRSSLDKVDLHLLAVFDAVYAHGGVGSAARHLNLSQPAISHSLARLRDVLGDRLFVRHGNGFVPTSRARELIGPVRAALQGLAAVLSATPHFEPSTSKRRFNIGLRPSTELAAFSAFVERLMRDAPDISIASRYFSRSNLSSALADGTLDLAIDVPLDISAGAIALPLRSERLHVFARRGHPVGGSMDIDEYLAQEHVFVSPRGEGLGLEDAALAKLGLSRRVKVRCQQALAAWEMLAVTDMICTLPLAQVGTLQDIFGHAPFHSRSMSRRAGSHCIATRRRRTIRRSPGSAVSRGTTSPTPNGSATGIERSRERGCRLASWSSPDRSESRCGHRYAIRGNFV